MENKQPSTQRQHDYRKAMRIKAREGDAEAQALVKYWNDLSRESTQKAKSEGRSYDVKYGRKRRAELRELREKALAGDEDAANVVQQERAKARKWKEVGRRNKGMVPIAAYILQVKAAATPHHIKQAKWNEAGKKYYHRLMERVKANDPKAIAEYEKRLANARICGKRWRDNKKREKAGVPQ